MDARPLPDPSTSWLSRCCAGRDGHPWLKEWEEQHPTEDVDAWSCVRGTISSLDNQILRVVDPEQAERFVDGPVPVALASHEDGQSRTPALRTPSERSVQRAHPAAQLAHEDGKTGASSASGRIDGDVRQNPLLGQTDEGRDTISPALAAAAERVGALNSMGGGMSLSAQAAQVRVDQSWQRMLATKVAFIKNGVQVELTGRQVFGLHVAAERSPDKRVAFEHNGQRLVLSALEAGKLRGQLEAKSMAAIPAGMKVEIGGGSNGLIAAQASEIDDEAIECEFWFLSAEQIRASDLKQLPSFAKLQENYPEWLTRGNLNLSEACTVPPPHGGAALGAMSESAARRLEGAAGVSGDTENEAGDGEPQGVGTQISNARRTVLAVSHRWETTTQPDPSGAQMEAIRAHLIANPEIKHVWYDYSCIPNGEVRASRQLTIDRFTCSPRCASPPLLPIPSFAVQRLLAVSHASARATICVTGARRQRSRRA